jgi:Carbohydrate binding module (family 6)
MSAFKFFFPFLAVVAAVANCPAAETSGPHCLVAWDGEQAAVGSGWTHVDAQGEVGLRPQTVVAHSGRTALEFRCKGTDWLGAGWNWVAFVKGAGTDVRAMQRLLLWVKCSGRGGDLQINLLCGGQEFDTPEHHTEKVHLLNYCPTLLDGAWHRVAIPLADLRTVAGYDPTKVAELQMGLLATQPVDCSFFIDDIGFDDGAAQGISPYLGVPFHDSVYQGGPQLIPGKLQNEYYDTMDIPNEQKAAGAEEGITYHDSDNRNSGSGTFNGTGSYLKEFRMFESPDISYTKFNNPESAVDDSPYNLVKPEPDSLYLGWIAPGEWVNYTVKVEADGVYSLNIMYTSKFGGHISFDCDGVDVSGPLAIPSTFNAADPIEWRQAHHWNKIFHVGKLHLQQGVHVLTLHFIDQPVMNFDYMEFVPGG